MKQIGIENLVKLVHARDDGYLFEFDGDMHKIATMPEIIPCVQALGYEVLRYQLIKAKKSSSGITKGRTYLSYNASDRFYYAFDDLGSTQQLRKEDFLVKGP